ncbi:MAG TPA: hypothetical protein VET48_02900, partial [Steroidobacteraceae bacterium]|nr:hypothetical protein [Steroidobacteraceae bacterium]
MKTPPDDGAVQWKRFAAATALSFLGCVAIAADFDQAVTSHDDELVRPPPKDWSPFLPKAETAARSSYPDLFAGKFTGTKELVVDLDIDGNVAKIDKLDFPPGPLTEKSYSKALRESGMEIFIHDSYRRVGSAGRKFIDWFGPKHTNGLYLSYRVLKWRPDP